MPSIMLVNAAGECLCQTASSAEATLYYDRPYQEGDRLRVVGGEHACHLRLQVDQAIQPANLYLPTGVMEYVIPFGESTRAYAPNAFQGDRHLVSARLLTDEEIHAYRNIAENPADQRGDVLAWPHATANVETRGESVFAARNVIDGFTVNHNHGDWPFQSWGIGTREDAFLTIDFGRPVCIDTLEVFLRADFPHDAYWTQAVVTLSDGSEHLLPLVKTGEGQRFFIADHTITWLRFDRMVKCTDSESPFPALTELRVFGRDC